MRRRQVLILLASTAPALMRAFGAGAADQRPTGLFRVAFLESTSVQSFRDAFEQGGHVDDRRTHGEAAGIDLRRVERCIDQVE